MINNRLYSLIFITLLATGLSACGGGGSGRSSNSGNTAVEQEPVFTAQDMLAQFGECQNVFSEAGLRELLDFDDSSSPILLLQLINPLESGEFSEYETQAEAVWDQFGARQRFASRIFARMSGDRTFLEARVIEFPNISMLIDAFFSEPFAQAMASLCLAASDHAWIAGAEQTLPFNPEGSYFDPKLQGLDQQEAVALLQSLNSTRQQQGSASESGIDNVQAIIDMIVSDSPEPFYMINLVDYRENAEYPDGRESDLSGEEANSIYGEAILPKLQDANSGPVMLIPDPIVLTEGSAEWEEIPLVRYASRDAFLNIFVLDPSTGEDIIHKWAGIENTQVFASEQRHDTPPEPVNGYLYNYRYCEILLPIITDGDVTAEVWGTQGVNNCPQQAWDAINPRDIAEQFGAPTAIKNGVRFFVMDWVSGGDLRGGERRFYGDLEMALLTTVVALQATNQGNSAYNIAQVARDNVWHFVSGRRIYELIDPDGNRFVMQSYSQNIDSELSLEDLETLGERLELPEGWSFESRALLEPLAVPAVDGIAEVVQDELSNTYQRIP